MIHNLEIATLNVIRLYAHLTKVLVAVMLWTGLAGPLTVVHARALNLAQSATTKMKQHAQHIAEQADHGHNGGMARRGDGAPIGDPECLQFCAELLDTPAVLSALAERPLVDFVKNLVLAHAELYSSGGSVVVTTALASATGPPFGYDSNHYQYATGLSALLARNHRLRI